MKIGRCSNGSFRWSCSLIRVLFLLVTFALTSPALAQGSVSALRPLKQTGLVLGGLAAGGIALHCAGRPECMPGFKALVRKGREKLLRSEDDTFEYIPPPRNLPGFPGAEETRGKTKAGGGRRFRWRLPNGDLAEWDSQHDEVELYDKHGKHKGVADPQTGKRIKPAVPGRRIET